MEKMRQPAWEPSAEVVAASNLNWLMNQVGIDDYPALHRWTCENRAEFWRICLSRLDIVFASEPRAMLEGSAQHARWLPGAEMNIAASVLDGPDDSSAVIHGTAGARTAVTYAELRADVARCANGMSEQGIGPGDAVAIVMPMTYEALVAYLAIVVLGGSVVSIADSFASEEIATRMELADARWAVTQSATLRAGKHLPMFQKVIDAGVERAIVVAGAPGPQLRQRDIGWDDLQSEDALLRIHVAEATAPTNILFSSGTTGEPKAIPWSHISPIKAAMDAHFHQDVHQGDVVAWPTNLGWMMGPWLIYGALINNAAVALCDDAPLGHEFVKFVEEAGVTVLGVVPSLVAAWKTKDLLSAVDWSGLKCFSSTGEASKPEDMEYLMAAAGGRPVIEYCGGTEIAGGYITGTILQPAVASTFTTPSLGLDLVLVDESGQVANEGEVLLVPPSIGLSTQLLNRNHDEVYYDDELPDLGMPLRRHGDHMERLHNGYWRALGRVDDTMNLGGIKVSSAELERVVGGIGSVTEVAAIAVPPAGGGPERLVVYAVPQPGSTVDRAKLKAAMQQEVRAHLNPLFKVHDVVLADVLPRTASQKVMRRTLRAAYHKSEQEPV